MMPRLPRSAAPGTALALVTTLLAMGLAACVPQDDTTIAGNEQNDGGISGTGYSSGPVDGFGSIYVNGIRYETANAELYLNGDKYAGSQARERLGVGMVVTVTGSRNAQGDSGTAETVRYRPLLKGPVEETSSTLPTEGVGTLTVLGRTVTIDRGTVFADRTGKGLIGPEAITTEHAVEISGYPEGDGFRATRLTVAPSGQEAAIGARVTATNADNTTLTLSGDTTVTYGTDTTIERLPEDASDWIGKTVHVRGDLAGDQLQADTITGLTGLGLELPADEDGEVEATGRITARDEGADTFGFNGATVHLTSATEFDEGGRDALTVGRRVELEAEYRDGTLTAEAIEFLEEPTETVFEGALEAVGSVDANGRVKHLTLFGVELAVTPRTRLDLDEEGGPLSTGDCVEVLLRPASSQADADGDGALALQLEREDDEGCEAEIEGTVTEVNGDTVVIAGVTVDLSGTGTSASVGDRLEVEGSWGNDTFQASEVEVEREDEEDDD